MYGVYMYVSVGAMCVLYEDVPVYGCVYVVCM